LGDARLASEELGQEIVDTALRMAVEFLDDFIADEEGR
jgi:creatinine amidohydrolase/Fe(II)-dependent formamide hydrolase-like protein